MLPLTVLLSLLIAASLVYCVLTIIAARKYLAVRPPPLRNIVPISILKPLAGAEEGLRENLRSFFEQDYPSFEIVFAVHYGDDPAAGVVARLQMDYPAIASKLIVTGEPSSTNAKVFSLERLVAEAHHQILLMADSDVRVSRAMLRTIAAEFEDEGVGLITCPYIAVPGHSFWSTLEAIGLNTEFIAGVLVARMLDGMKFALGPAIALRKEVLHRIGGFDCLKHYLAEDFMLGKLAAEAGYGVILSSYVIGHHIGGQSFRANLRHRIRWARSTRRSRPLGYAGQIFTNPLPPALLLWIGKPHWWPLVVVTFLLRAAAAWVVAGWALHDSLTRKLWWLVPLQDVASFLVWIAGFFGNTILWRGRKYRLFSDGKFQLLEPR